MHALFESTQALATFGFAGDETLDALDAAVVRLAPEIDYPQEVANIIWSFGTIGTQPTEDAVDAIDSAVERLASRFNEQHLCRPVRKPLDARRDTSQV